MNYTIPHILSENAWNNAFSYDIRDSKSLSIPSLIGWTLDDVRIGNAIVFEEVKNGKIRSCMWLEHFVRLQGSSIPITIFDNHNHALYFWYEALSVWVISPWAELIHIDEHSDLWENTHTIKSHDLEDIWHFTNYQCNVGNYIVPAIRDGLIGKITRIENEYQLDEYMGYSPSENSILNLDLDFFSPEMDFISEKKKIKIIQNLLPKVRCVSIATSPYFIDQWLAIEKLRKIFQQNESDDQRKELL